jgi:hypothetical protein
MIFHLCSRWPIRLNDDADTPDIIRAELYSMSSGLISIDPLANY